MSDVVETLAKWMPHAAAGTIRNQLTIAFNKHRSGIPQSGFIPDLVANGAVCQCGGSGSSIHWGHGIAKGHEDAAVVRVAKLYPGMNNV